MLGFLVIDAQHPRLLFSLPRPAAVRSGTQSASSAKSFPLKPFADHRHLTPFMSNLYKNVGGEGHLRFFGPTISTIPFRFTPLPTFVHSRKTQPYCFQSFPHSLGKTPGWRGCQRNRG